jgi:hypothetical protein
VKHADAIVSPHLRYFYEKYQLPAVQAVKELKRERVEKGIEVVQGLNFLRSLFFYGKIVEEDEKETKEGSIDKAPKSS